ncbi:hypothetical protein ACFQWB_02785 [Paenibacillus thermoaerophilus]|uniref:Uncharacterized protein n=1 Tax=Paenibacillus thermoaerophilus TaxID=1215385 RepID=A0ABW2UYB3_9BACL|nr:hypothetical protein [Paenibacillus thermoaerophilus]TMV17755.1 hypothetical protein FE781_06410 [Paenibacillus thermoaerophilus]
MIRRMRYRLTAFGLALALAAGSALPAYADGITDGPAAEVASTSIGAVYITGKSYIEVKQAAMLEGDGNKTLAFTLTLHNNDDYEIQFIDYWVRLSNQAGTSFSVSLLPQDKDKNRVPAHSSLDLNMIAKVSESTNFSDLSFRIVKWDFSAPNYERTLGTLKVPADYAMAAPAGSARIVNAPGSAVKMSIRSASVGKNSSYYLPKVQLFIENVGSRTAELPPYQFAIRTSEGLLYPLEAKGFEEKDRSLHPRFTRDVQLTGTIPASVSPDGWELVVTNQTDMNGSKLTLPVAMFVMPEATDVADDSAVPSGQSTVIEHEEWSLLTKVSRFIRMKSDAYYQAAMTFTIKNESKSSVKLPEYRFLLQTADGLTYPAKAEGLKDLSIDPLVSKDISLTASIPTSVSAEGWKLLLLPAADPSQPDRTSDTRLAVYELADTKDEQGVIGVPYDFAVGGGSYQATLEGIQRMPWDEQDILAANLTLSGKMPSSQPIPSLSGYFLLDNLVRIPAQLVVKDNAVTVSKSRDVQMLLYGKLPYSTGYASIKVVLQETNGENKQDLLEFRTGSETVGLPEIAVDSSHRVNNTGRKSQMSVRSVRSYPGISDAELFTVQFNVRNLEKRLVSIGNMVAYFKDDNDALYPAEISKVTKKIGPGSIATLLVSAYLPSGIDRDQLKLIVGTGVKDGQPVTGDAAPDAYIDAVSFALPKENKEPKKDFANLDFYPYTVSLSRFHAQPVSITVGGGGIVSFGFDYELSKNPLVEASDRKLVLEFKDLAGSFVISRTFELGKSGAEGALPVGKNRKVITFNDDILFHKLPYLNQYKVEIYEEFNGEKRLLASKQFDWNVMSE